MKSLIEAPAERNVLVSNEAATTNCQDCALIAQQKSHVDAIQQSPRMIAQWAMIQRLGVEDEEPLQGKFAVAERDEGLSINDDVGLEQDADAMGIRAIEGGRSLTGGGHNAPSIPARSSAPLQLRIHPHGVVRLNRRQALHLPVESTAQRVARVDKINNEAKTVSHPDEEAAADSIKSATDKAVTAIATGPVADPKDAGWLGRLENVLRSDNGPWAATLGYAVETIATPLCEGQKHGAGTLLSQQTRGGTRPDFVSAGVKGDHGWFDITSEAGHVKSKAGNWETRSDFPTYEIVYDQISRESLARIRGTSRGDNSGILKALGEMAAKKDDDLNRAREHFAKYPVINSPSSELINNSDSDRKEASKNAVAQASVDLLAGSVTQVRVLPQAARAILSWYRGNTSFMYQYGMRDVGGGGPAQGALLVNLMMDLEKPALATNGVDIELNA